MTSEVENKITLSPFLESIIKFNNASLMRSQDWWGRKAFLAVNSSGECNFVILTFIQRIRRWFGDQEFANTLPEQLAQFLKDKDINELVSEATQGDNPDLRAAAYRIVKFSNKWLTVGRFLDQITQIIPRRNIPPDLYSHLSYHKHYLIDIRGEEIDAGRDAGRPNGRLHHEIMEFLSHRNITQQIPSKEELNLWGRLTEVLKRMGWDFNGDRSGRGNAFWGSPFHELIGLSENNSLIDFYFDHGADPTVPHTNGSNACYDLYTIETVEKLIKYFQEKKIKLEDVHPRGYNLLENAAKNHSVEIMQCYVKHGMKLTTKALCYWAKRTKDPKEIMHLLTSPDEFTRQKNEYGKTPLECYNESVIVEMRQNKSFKLSCEGLKELTVEDVEQRFANQQNSPL